ncbi:hypothetical protein SAMN05216553_11849 [Lentzea fradiae]|uniref:Uncharacterized protein n=1 Tax=Lentzea fradiae TaxID=200378 RepID=A0A1G8AR68_9PSEU|nr:hypothetical protein [Lentzea fradiae]SDH23226.1 hypothetical protein SAMN05216553_11849 [Lentzea fradiae]
MPSSEFGPDGTQVPPPPRLFSDPTAGLVTADTWVAPQWTVASFTSRVSVPTPPAPAEEIRQAVWSQLESEHRRSYGGPRHAQRPQWPAGPQTPVVHQHQPAERASALAGFLGCVVVLGFIALVLFTLLTTIFSG